MGFGLEESNRIYKALKRLAEDKQATRLRFWGKILTRSGDYYVLEGVTKHSNAGEPTGDMEKAKEGANYNTYWVAHGSCNTTLMQCLRIGTNCLWSLLSSSGLPDSSSTPSLEPSTRRLYLARLSQARKNISSRLKLSELPTTVRLLPRGCTHLLKTTPMKLTIRKSSKCQISQNFPISKTGCTLTPIS